MEKETNKSKLKDDQYFANLEQKMMQHANENEHNPSVIPLYTRWISVAALIALGILSFNYFSRDNIEKQIAIDSQDSNKQVAFVKEQPIDKEKTKEAEAITSELKIEQAEKAIIQQVKLSEIEEVIPTESSETEEDLLDIITEEELDELLAEYT